jgi:hypothetical protein
MPGIFIDWAKRAFAILEFTRPYDSTRKARLESAACHKVSGPGSIPAAPTSRDSLMTALGAGNKYPEAQGLGLGKPPFFHIPWDCGDRAVISACHENRAWDRYL